MKFIAPSIDMPKLERGFRAAVIVSKKHVKTGTDEAIGFLVLEALQKMGVSDLRYREQPSKPEALRRMMLAYCDEGLNLVLVLGGTAAAQGPRTIKSLAGRERSPNLSPDKSPSKKLSKGYTVMATRKKTLMAAVPGSLTNLNYALKALRPYLFESFLDGSGPVAGKLLAQAA
jgi:cyclic pyranopterin phosphate synthase